VGEERAGATALVSAGREVGSTKEGWVVDLETEGSGRLGEGSPCEGIEVGFKAGESGEASGGDSGNRSGVEKTRVSSLETGVVGVIGAIGAATILAAPRAFALPPICSGALAGVTPAGLTAAGLTAAGLTAAATRVGAAIAAVLLVKVEVEVAGVTEEVMVAG